MSLLPDPVPLDPPAGRAGAVTAAADDAVASARLLEELAGGLRRAWVTGWHGADADATEARRSSVARIGTDAAEALHRAALRLRRHADQLAEVTARAGVLRDAQDAEFAVARHRVAVPFDPADPFAAAPEVVLAVLRAAEVSRAAEHRLLTTRLAEDTADTVRVLADCTAVVTGTPRYDPDLATLHLATLLPAWGTPEIAHRGHLLAWTLTHSGTEKAEAVLAADLDLAAHPAYAAALVRGLSPNVVAGLLSTIWSGQDPDGRRTDLLARAFSGLDRDATGPPWLASLLDDAREAGGAESVSGGLAAVLARARASAAAGPPPALAAAWARSMITEEHATGIGRVAVGIRPAGADPATSDPLALAVAALVDQHAALEAARLMADRDAWTVVLSRSWDDGALRDGLVATVAAAPEDAARPALRNALVALGTGLEDGDPDGWPFVEKRLDQALPPLARALVQHVDVLTAPLAGAATGSVDAVSVTALRGLAVVVELGTGSGVLIDEALSTPHPEALEMPAGSAVLAAVAAPAAFVGVREYGARLLHAVEQHRHRDEAEAKAIIWEWTFGISFALLGHVPAIGRVAGALERVATRVLHTDGSWSNSPDDHEHHTAGDGVRGATGGLEPHIPADGAAAREAAARVAALAFAGAVGVLGEPEIPRAPHEPLLREVAEELVGEFVGGELAGRAGVPPPFDGAVGGLLTSGW